MADWMIYLEARPPISLERDRRIADRTQYVASASFLSQFRPDLPVAQTFIDSDSKLDWREAVGQVAAQLPVAPPPRPVPQPVTNGQGFLDACLDAVSQVGKFVRKNPVPVGIGIGLLAIGLTER